MTLSLTALLLKFQWWNLEPARLVDFLSLLCDSNLDQVKDKLHAILS